MSNPEPTSQSAEYNLGAMNASIGYINKSIEKIDHTLQNLDTKIDNVAKELGKVSTDMTCRTVMLDTRMKVLVGGVSAIATLITNALLSVVTSFWK